MPRTQSEGMAAAGCAAEVPVQTVFDEFADRIDDYRNMADDITGELRRKVDRITGAEPPSDTPVMGKDANQPSTGIDKVLMTLDQLSYELNRLQQQVARMTPFCGD